MRRVAAVTVRALALLLALAGSSSAWAWGASGHRISALVAEELLSPAARSGITALMGRVDLAADAVVLDQQKDTLAQRMPGSRRWHYDAQPLCTADTPAGGFCAGGHCATAQIARHAAVLADTTRSDDSRRFALLVLVHVVGDLTQPLHAITHGDGGGNGVAVRFRLPGDRPGRALRRDNLHAAWDSAFVRGAFAKVRDERVVARRLLDGMDAATRARWAQGSAADWQAEAHQIAKTRIYAPLYAQFTGLRCPAPDAEAAPPRDLDDDAVRDAIALVPQQLARAGVRIAAVLNQAFAP